jgi:chromate transporter
MLDLTALAQSSPGAIAVNAAILTGYRMEGILGVIASVLGTVIPPVTTLSVISLCYGIFRDSPLVQAVLKGMQAGVAAVICDVVLDLSGKVVKTKSVLSILLMIAAFVLVYFFDLSVILVILVAAILGVVIGLVRKK